MKVSSLVVATLVVVAAAVIGIGHESQFVFDPETMHRVAKQAIADNPANDPQGIVDSVRSLLKKESPDYIVDDSEWLFNNAGGAMGAMVVSSAFHSHPPRPLHELTLPLFSFPGPARVPVGVRDHLRLPNRHGGTLRQVPLGRLLYHLARRAVGLLSGTADQGGECTHFLPRQRKTAQMNFLRRSRLTRASPRPSLPRLLQQMTVPTTKN